MAVLTIPSICVGSTPDRIGATNCTVLTIRHICVFSIPGRIGVSNSKADSQDI